MVGRVWVNVTGLPQCSPEGAAHIRTCGSGLARSALSWTRCPWTGHSAVHQLEDRRGCVQKAKLEANNHKTWPVNGSSAFCFRFFPVLNVLGPTPRRECVCVSVCKCTCMPLPGTPGRSRPQGRGFTDLPAWWPGWVTKHRLWLLVFCDPIGVTFCDLQETVRVFC